MHFFLITDQVLKYNDESRGLTCSQCFRRIPIAMMLEIWTESLPLSLVISYYIVMHATTLCSKQIENERKIVKCCESATNLRVGHDGWDLEAGRAILSSSWHILQKHPPLIVGNYIQSLLELGLKLCQGGVSSGDTEACKSSSTESSTKRGMVQIHYTTAEHYCQQRRSTH